MDIEMFNYIRPEEVIPQRTIINKTLQDVTNENLLSSPISSYTVKVNPEDASELHVTYPSPYTLRIKVIYFHLYMIRFLPNNHQRIKGQVEALRDETRGLRIDYANTRYSLAQLRRDHAQLSYDHAQLSNNFQQLWNE
jgi:hypothetical protein